MATCLLYAGVVKERSFFLLTTNRFSPLRMGIISGKSSLVIALVTSGKSFSSAIFLNHFSDFSACSLFLSSVIFVEFLESCELFPKLAYTISWSKPTFLLSSDSKFSDFGPCSSADNGLGEKVLE
ncbi:hypothetical protein V8G54_035691 [Vigna mungo]|uniref:Uncharacterized protein n=1 Tax=Vigna mungo TaxID=3915 RepID=A0AAQ3REU6_VIGMU